MPSKQSPMEIMRQFLAAFAYQDQESLIELLASDIKFKFNCHEKIVSGESSQKASDLLMEERSRWVQSRMDVKSWQSNHEGINVKFHVQYGEDIFTEYLEYVADITIQADVIKTLQMVCSEKESSGKLPIWEKTNMSFNNASAS